jgi:hypothetical protein
MEGDAVGCPAGGGRLAWTVGSVPFSCLASWDGPVPTLGFPSWKSADHWSLTPCSSLTFVPGLPNGAGHGLHIHIDTIFSSFFHINPHQKK